MRTVTSITLLFVMANCLAQNEITFNVEKKKKVNIECKFDTLVGSSFYYFKVYGISPKEIIPGKFSGGQVWMNDTAVCIHTGDKTIPGKKYLLELFQKKNNASVFSKNFTIVPKAKMQAFNPVPTRFINAQPDIYFSSTAIYQRNYTLKKDSVLQKLTEILSSLNASSFSKSRITVNLQMTFECNGVKEVFAGTGLELTAEMKEKIKRLNGGCKIMANLNYHSFSDPPQDSPMGPYQIEIY